MDTETKNKLQILIVDDEQMIREMLEEYLESLDYKVYCSPDAEKAIGILHKEKIDIVISDFKMPKISGTDFLEAVYKDYPKTVRILMTGYPDLINAKDAINKCGVFKYLVKPIDLNELNEAVNFGKTYLLSQRKESRKLHQLEEDLDRLIQLSLAFSNESDIDNLLQMIIYEAKKFCTADTAVLYIRNDDKLQIKEIISKSLNQSEQDNFLGINVEIDGNLVPQFVAKTGEILRVEDTGNFEFKNIVDIEADYISQSNMTLKSILGIPIKNNVFKVLGVIELVNKIDEESEQDYFSERDEEIVRSLSSLAGASLQNLNLIKDLQEVDDRRSKFMTILGHELRTPVAILNEYINILAEGTCDDLETKQHLFSTSIKNIEHLKELVEDIINIAKKDYSVTYEKISVKSYLKKALSVFLSAVKDRNIAVQISKGNDIMIEAEPGRFLMVLRNLIGNAVKYTPDGGTVKLIIKKIDYIVEIVVQDSGIGIVKDQLEKIFEGFHHLGDESVHSTSKTKFRGGGIGLGLYISRQIIEDHRGKIWAESDGENKGSRFIINMPISQSGF